VIRLFYHENYPGVWMLDMSKEFPNSFLIQSDVVTLKKDDIIIGYNLLNMPESDNGHHYIGDEELILINQKLTDCGIEPLQPEENPLYVGEITDWSDINNKVKVVQVDIGREKIQIVTTASNIVISCKVVVALPGAVLYNGDIISESRIYDHLSQGAFVSKHSLWGRDEDLGEILVLPQDIEVGIVFTGATNKENKAW